MQTRSVLLSFGSSDCTDTVVQLHRPAPDGSPPFDWFAAFVFCTGSNNITIPRIASSSRSLLQIHVNSLRRSGSTPAVNYAILPVCNGIIECCIICIPSHPSFSGFMSSGQRLGFIHQKPFTLIPLLRNNFGPRAFPGPIAPAPL